MKGVVAEEKLTLLKSIFSLSNFSAYINTDEVLAVPDPPTNTTVYWSKLISLSVLGLLS
jgi:hypothetical protein